MEPHRKTSVVFVTTIALLFLLVQDLNESHAGVNDPTVQTDHAFYPGEGAFQTIEDCVTFATKGKKIPQEKAIAMFQWLLNHQFHLHSPQEWNIPGLTPGTGNHPDMVVYDANRGRFSYGYGLCGTVHAWNEPYWKALKMPPRRRAFPGHTNSEIFYNAGWHVFDTDMAGLVFRPDGVVAGYDDIVKDLECVKLNNRSLPCYPFAWPQDFQVMKKGWQEVAKGGSWHKLYHGGYAAHPGIVMVRRGETFIRTYDPDVFGGVTRRRFWHHQKNGPDRYWSFVNQGEPFHNEKTSNARGRVAYCNAQFQYVPNFTSDGWLEGVKDRTSNVTRNLKSGGLYSADGNLASVTFQHFSPYVICGDPEDDENPMSRHATDGLILKARTEGKVKVELSTDLGQSWKEAGTFNGTFSTDLTDSGKGHYGWQIRFSWSGTTKLKEVSFATTCQMANPIYPRLSENGSKIQFQATSRKVIPVLPNFSLPEADQIFEVQKERSSNVQYQPRSVKNRYVYKTTNNKPGDVVFRLDSPLEPLTEVRAAVRFAIRVPPPKETDYRLDVSFDQGSTWQPLSKADIPRDNEYSSGWMYGKIATPPEVHSAWVKAHFYAGGYTTGLIEAELYGISQAKSASPVSLTIGWKEGAKEKQFHWRSENLSPENSSATFNIPTGSDIVDQMIKIHVP